MARLTVFTFSAAWGLPSAGPFALKLLKWLDLAGLDYEQRFEDSPGKGPLGKNPWIEIDGERMGDTEAIIRRLAGERGFDIDAGLSPALNARNHAIRRMVEEHFHQVLEWELFVHPAGRAFTREMAEKLGAPRAISGGVAAAYAGRFVKQLKARGISRHAPETIARKGRDDLNSLEALLGSAPYFGGDRYSMADISVFGLLAPMAKWSMRTPVADDLKARSTLTSFVDRMLAANATKH